MVFVRMVDAICLALFGFFLKFLLLLFSLFSFFDSPFVVVLVHRRRRRGWSAACCLDREWGAEGATTRPRSERRRNGAGRQIRRPARAAVPSHPFGPPHRPLPLPCDQPRPSRLPIQVAGGVRVRSRKLSASAQSGSEQRDREGDAERDEAAQRQHSDVVESVPPARRPPLTAAAQSRNFGTLISVCA